MIPASVRIFVCMEPQDMRRGFDALALTVRQVIGEDATPNGISRRLTPALHAARIVLQGAI
ncbi:hypothetical protein OV079_49180 [Nannocystis pusilla]|uniref:Uncharacterized protein n=1 Tax=Nannocystis pusilla TaxID=889268 RepID=A0A9X3EZV6_9BACT|nr:hypothetical protein [Nannocystis pusilla]MCY1013373.1 hypothetical protein [Nannocystis pusilla]